MSDTHLYVMSEAVSNMPNRVADLESTVAQLKATVDGLREEVVDANERIRALEQELEAGEDTPATPRETATEVKDNGESERSPASVDDIIVA